MRPRILVSESAGFSPRAAELLGSLGELILADLDRAGLQSAVRDAEILWVRLRHKIDANIMSAGSRLRTIVTPTTGLNHIDLDEARRRGIGVLSLQGETEFLKDVRATAEHTVGLMLALLRKIPAATSHVREGGWNRDLFKGQELHRKTVGIVGYGRLGKIVARYARAFDARVLVAVRAQDATLPDSEIELTSLEQLLGESDLVSLHVNLDDETRGFFGKAQFGCMKMGAWFINTARGELIDESALLEALTSGRIAGAALDVLSNESSGGMTSHPLVRYAREHDNLMITPHIGGCTTESMHNTEVFLAEKLRDGEQKGGDPYALVTAGQGVTSKL